MATFYALISGPFQGGPRSAKLTNHVKVTLSRTLLSLLTVKELQYVATGLDDLYYPFAKKEGFEPKSITLEDGTKAYWLGDPDAKNVLIYFHGGGYNAPPDPLHLTFANSLTSSKTSVLMLAYTLAPHATYPNQLRQAVSLLSLLLTERKVFPENISMGGDSAGGNLVLAVLSHILHPRPDIPCLDLHGGRFRGAILLCPWATFDTSYASVKYNGPKDYVSKTVNDRWSKSFLGGATSDGYTEPLLLPPEDPWWVGLEGVVTEILVTVGGDEILLDSVIELTSRLKVRDQAITFSMTCSPFGNHLPLFKQWPQNDSQLCFPAYASSPIRGIGFDRKCTHASSSSSPKANGTTCPT